MGRQTIIPGYTARKESLETFAIKLLDKIIHAPSESAIERYIAVALKALDNEKVNGYIIQRFIDRVTLELDYYSPAGEQQVANVRMARGRLQQLRKGIAGKAQI